MSITDWACTKLPRLPLSCGEPVIQRFSELFVKTLRDDPTDAEVPSHQLLMRAGYIRRVAPGVFSWLPLGVRVLRKVEEIVRDEMNSAGFQEVHFPALLPKEPYEVTNRWAEYGPTLFRLQDRRGADYLLGPTHEEMFTLLVKEIYSSYRELPLVLYQIQTKYRDEARPRAGILRGREFVMKDAYSFDVDEAGLVRSYQRNRDAYVKIFKRLSLDYVIVSATSGAMGGSVSEEFLAPCVNGEDSFVTNDTASFAANVEAFVSVAPSPPLEADVAMIGPAHAEETPDTPTIESLVACANDRADLRRDDRQWQAADTLKNVVFKLTEPTGQTSVLAVGLPGDREIDMRRLEASVAPSTVAAFEDSDFIKHKVLVKGYIGPTALGEKSASAIKYLVDPRVVSGTRWLTGANEPGKHVFDLVAGRDFTADGVIDVAEVREGDPSPNGDGTVRIQRGIEIGHIFQLGRKYAEAFDLTVLDADGERVVVTMGSYGIGVTRAVAAIVEQHHDELGLVWPMSVAPYQVHIISAGKDEQVIAAAELLAEQLSDQGFEVLLDDRAQASTGVKFNDAELLGVPLGVVVGRGLANGVVELRNRATGQTEQTPVSGAFERIVGLINDGR